MNSLVVQVALTPEAGSGGPPYWPAVGIPDPWVLHHGGQRMGGFHSTSGLMRSIKQPSKQRRQCCVNHVLWYLVVNGKTHRIQNSERKAKLPYWTSDQGNPVHNPKIPWALIKYIVCISKPVGPEDQGLPITGSHEKIYHLHLHPLSNKRQQKLKCVDFSKITEKDLKPAKKYFYVLIKRN